MIFQALEDAIQQQVLYTDPFVVIRHMIADAENQAKRGITKSKTKLSKLKDLISKTKSPKSKEELLTSFSNHITSKEEAKISSLERNLEVTTKAKELLEGMKYTPETSESPYLSVGNYSTLNTNSFK